MGGSHLTLPHIDLLRACRDAPTAKSAGVSAGSSLSASSSDRKGRKLFSGAFSPMIVGDSFSCRLAGTGCDGSSPMVTWQTGSGIVCNGTIRGPHGSGGSGNASIFRGFSRVPAFFSNREGYLTLTACSRVLVCSGCQL